MRGRESGMPEESCWQGFYDADAAVVALECARRGSENVADFGSGYGTFTLPVARRTTGTVYAFDIDRELVARLRRRATDAGLDHVNVVLRDFIADGTGLADASVDHVMVYNILHVDGPVALLREAWRVLRPGGIVSIIHWKHDAATPRGPSMPIRPCPEQCRAWGAQAGFEFVRDTDLAACCRYHYGMLLARPSVRSGAA